MIKIERHPKVEIAVLTVASAAVVGGFAVRFAKNAQLKNKNREPSAAILTHPKLGGEKLQRINMIAAHILLNERVESTDLTRSFDYSRQSVSHLTGYLSDYGLITRVVDYAQNEYDPRSYWVATETLAAAALDDRTNYRLTTALLESARLTAQQKQGLPNQ